MKSVDRQFQAQKLDRHQISYLTGCFRLRCARHCHCAGQLCSCEDMNIEVFACPVCLEQKVLILISELRSAVLPSMLAHRASHSLRVTEIDFTRHGPRQRDDAVYSTVLSFACIMWSKWVQHLPLTCASKTLWSLTSCPFSSLPLETKCQATFLGSGLGLFSCRWPFHLYFFMPHNNRDAFPKGLLNSLLMQFGRSS